MSTWIDRFAAMSVADRFQTIAEDPSTLDALLREVETLSNAATGILNMYGPPSEYGGVSREMWQRLADALDVKDLNGPAGGALVGQTVPTESTGASHAREPCIGRDPLCPCQDGDSCHYVDTEDTKAWPIPETPS